MYWTLLYTVLDLTLWTGMYWTLLYFVYWCVLDPTLCTSFFYPSHCTSVYWTLLCVLVCTGPVYYTPLNWCVLDLCTGVYWTYLQVCTGPVYRYVLVLCTSVNCICVLVCVLDLCTRVCTGMLTHKCPDTWTYPWAPLHMILPQFSADTVVAQCTHFTQFTLHLLGYGLCTRKLCKTSIVKIKLHWLKVNC